ncbi:MAG TPA: hypothetical protein VFS19_06590 [Planctomycetota bacterium]|nr:hypothetical protein [Planctomycetota bacterium]
MSSLVLVALLIAQQSPAVELCSGSRPRVSPDGRWVGFHRSVETDDTDLRGNSVWRTDVWIRDLGSGEEKRLAMDSWLSGWVDATTAVFHGGKTAGVTGVAPAIKAAQPPEGITACNRAWAAGGKRMAYVPIINWSGKNPGGGADRKIYIVDLGAPPKAIELGHNLMAEDEGVLSWSPDGKRLVYHLKFFRNGNLPVRRIGVIDLATGTNRFVGEGHQYGNKGFRLSERWGESPGTWDGKGERFVFVTGRGGDEAEVHLSNAAGTEVLQLTEDNECKWSPMLDPSGRRVAFCAGRVEKQTSDDERFPMYELVKGRIRVLDLYTGREEVVTTPKTAVASNVTWLKDGSGIVFDCWDGEESPALFQCKLPVPWKLEPGAALVSKPALTRHQRILKALASDIEEIVEWAAEQSRVEPDAAITAEVRKTLGRATKKGMTQAERALLFAISALDARDAAPEVIAAFESSYEANQCLALGMVAHWRLKEATDKILKIVERTPETETNVHAASALAWLSHETGWKVLERYCKSNEKSIRGAVAYSLDGLADPKAMGILISLADDSAVLYASYRGEVQVGDHAEKALATITGMTFDRKPIAWLSWWNQQSGKLPTVPSPNPALKKLEVEMERREKEWQEKLRKQQEN